MPKMVENTESIKRAGPKPWVRETKSKPIIAINQWGEETQYPSGREAARKLGLRQSGITYVLSGQRKTTGGYRFRYATEKGDDVNE